MANKYKKIEWCIGDGEEKKLVVWLAFAEHETQISMV